jgi:hypothetical protein
MIEGPVSRWRIVCSHCGEAIGVYEPTLVVGPDGLRITSLAREPGLPVEDRLVFHAKCAPVERSDDPEA